MKETDYQSGDCNYEAVKSSQSTKKWKKTGNYEEERYISDKYVKHVPEENQE